MNEISMRHHLKWLCANVALLLLLPSLALAVPTQVSQQGRLVDDAGEGLTGNHSLEFTLFSDSAGTTAVWSESHSTTLENGYYSVTLGADSSNPLDDSVLSLDGLYLGMTVDSGTLMQPLLEVTSAPYAINAANLAGGYADASEIYIDGTLVVDAAGDWVGNVLPGTLASLGCADGEQARYTTAGGWGCVSPGDHFTAADAVTAMGAEDPGNPLNHIRYSNTDAVAAMGALGSSNPLNHDRYSNSDAVAAMGSQSNTNSYNHARYTDTEAAAALNTADSYVRNTGDTMTGDLTIRTASPSLRLDESGSGPGVEWQIRSTAGTLELVQPSAFGNDDRYISMGGSQETITLSPGGDTALTANSSGDVSVDRYAFSERYMFNARTTAPYPLNGVSCLQGCRIQFGHQLVDRGGVYNGISTFTAPRDGYYSFSMSFSFRDGDNDSDPMLIRFFKNFPGGSSIQTLYVNPRRFVGDSNASMTTIARLDAGDDVAVVGYDAELDSPVRIRRGYFSGFYLGDDS